jgi:putative transposase
VDLLYLDEGGFSPTQPTGYSWAPHGERPLVDFEAPVRRRVNALVAYRPPLSAHGATLRYRVQPRPLTSQDLLGLLRTLPRPDVPCWVVLDNAAIHTSLRVRGALRALKKRGLHLFYLPAYAPELNEVEPILGVLKRLYLPERSYASLAALLTAVRRALRNYRTALHRK